MFRTRFAARVAAGFLAAGVVAAPAVASAQPPETSPAFNCLTMGNRVCGPQFGPLPTDHQRWMAKAYDIPRSAMRHALVEWWQDGANEEVMHVVVPAYRGHRQGRVLWF